MFEWFERLSVGNPGFDQGFVKRMDRQCDRPRLAASAPSGCQCQFAPSSDNAIGSVQFLGER